VATASAGTALLANVGAAAAIGGAVDAYAADEERKKFEREQEREAKLRAEQIESDEAQIKRNEAAKRIQRQGAIGAQGRRAAFGGGLGASSGAPLLGSL